MQKRWHKISELVESREFTKVEIIRACLDGEIPVYTPDGMQLFRINIPLEEIPYQFLLEHRLTRSSKPLENEVCLERLYRTYEDLKDCLLSDSDKEAYLVGLPSIMEARTFRTQYFKELAERKLQADAGGMSNDAGPANADPTRGYASYQKLLLFYMQKCGDNYSDPDWAGKTAKAMELQGLPITDRTLRSLRNRLLKFKKELKYKS